MRPAIGLDETVFRDNALVWRQHTGLPIRAVIKANAYNWSYKAAVRALTGVVDTFCVSDSDEFFELRKCTSARIVIFSSVPIEQLEQVLAADGVPTVEDPSSLARCIQMSRRNPKPLRIRLGVRQAVGWNGSSISQLRAFACELAGSAVEVELWSHLTDQTAFKEQSGAFTQAREILQEAGVAIVATDVASTLPAALGSRLGTSVRVGIGLFGATFGQHVPGIRCAIYVKAPIVYCTPSQSKMRVGYGGVLGPNSGYLVVARCGYSDGLPKTLAGTSDILSVGMQYVTLHSEEFKKEGDMVLLDHTANLDMFSAQANQSAHEIVTAFGNARTFPETVNE
ncbi:MAG: alanine racemase [Candidatus Eremiobacteraeota bacterium]|nr:alanine racemase [Candidatus Eremiobacteraeota bacterium]